MEKQTPSYIKWIILALIIVVVAMGLYIHFSSKTEAIAKAKQEVKKTAKAVDSLTVKQTDKIKEAKTTIINNYNQTKKIYETPYPIAPDCTYVAKRLYIAKYPARLK